MDAYKLYNVVPRLVLFVGELTNIYVRYNRKRLKGGGGDQDALAALTTLYATLLTLCKARTPIHHHVDQRLYCVALRSIAVRRLCINVGLCCSSSTPVVECRSWRPSRPSSLSTCTRI